MRFATPPTTWDEVLAGYPEPMRALTVQLRDAVRDALPQATESVRGAKMMGYAQYWLEAPDDVLVMISPEDAHVKLYIHHVRKDATGRLKVEGSGKNARHVKFTEIDEAGVRALLQQVVDARG